MMLYPFQSSTRPSIPDQSISVSSRNLAVLSPRSVEANGIIIGSVLGGTALLLVSLFLILYPVWTRRRARVHARRGHYDSKRIASRQSDRWSTPTPTPHTREDATLRPVTLSPRGLAIDATAAAVVAPPPRRWHLEKAGVHTPSGHPATTSRGDILTAIAGEHGHLCHNHHPRYNPGHDHHHRPHHNNDKNNSNKAAPREASRASVSSAFAAEISSLLESISLKSSYSSLRSGGLAAPPRLLQARRPAAAGDVEEKRESGCGARVFGPAGASAAPEDDCGGGGGPPRRVVGGPSSEGASHVILLERPGAGKWKPGGGVWRTW